ncbi:MAG TPA: hypothetical protein VMK12_32985 [Anaeromyxobacteraceae bacterium]|nr:hypothetical protein [Anaeromyxobacteraceae bacterium]
MHRLVYVAYGKEEFRVQALYSALSALAHAGEVPFVLHVCTDVPSCFGTIADQVVLRSAGPAEVSAWLGPQNFPLRAKPAVFREFSERYPADPILLVDSDTFFVSDVDRVLARIGPHRAVLWEREYHVATSETALMCRFRRRMRHAKWHDKPIRFDVDMWNTGVVGLHPSEASLISEWLGFVDEVYPRTRRWLLEQFAISYLLGQSGCAIHGCEDAVVHYWFDKFHHFSAVRAALDCIRGVSLSDTLAFVRANPIILPQARRFGRKSTFFQRVFGW